MYLSRYLFCLVETVTPTSCEEVKGKDSDSRMGGLDVARLCALLLLLNNKRSLEQ